LVSYKPTYVASTIELFDYFYVEWTSLLVAWHAAHDLFHSTDDLTTTRLPLLNIRYRLLHPMIIMKKQEVFSRQPWQARTILSK
jgi:hypothetical protein